MRGNSVHLVQDALASTFALLGLGSRTRRDGGKATATAQGSTVDSIRTTIPLPVAKSTVKNVDDGLQNALLLAWAVLLQRERSEDGRVESFVWRRRMEDASESCQLFKMSALDPDLSRGQSKPVSACLKAVKKLTPDHTRLPRYETLFFSDNPSLPLPLRQEQTEKERPTWTFQLEISRRRGTLTLKASWRKTNDAMTERLVRAKLDTFKEILSIITMRPTTAVADLFNPFDRDLDRIWAWNANMPPTIDRCMHDIISEQAAANPDKAAVSSWDGQLTYSQVEALSTRLAHVLRARGVTIGTYVPLCFEKSRWTIVAVLAVMKAGGAFALTDPTSQPEARLRAMVEQTGATLAVASASQSALAQLIVPENGQVVTVSDELLCVEDDTLSPPLPAVPASTALYIQFTSGSTGRPKGVVISHVNYTSGAVPRAEAVGYAASSRVFEFASYAFDVSIDCMLCTLSVGGTICIPSDADRMNDLGGAIRSSGANMAHMTPSVARVLNPEVISGLDVLGLGGEAVSAADAAAWSKGKTSVVIAYGPSECTVGCTVNNTFSHGKDHSRKTFTTGNIGRGVGGVGWIVDPEDPARLVPLGAVGELIIEGPVVGVGYLGEPEKTAEVFINEPAWLAAGHGAMAGRRGRLYKTGDLVRYDSDGSGSIIFVGRKDAQVKLRGQRVELVEIEHHLRGKLPAALKIAAEVIKPIGGEPTLVAFIAEASSTQIDGKGPSFSAELAQALAGVSEALVVEIPRYMVPAAYIPILEMPSLVSGKIDRKMLREMGAAMTRAQVASGTRREMSSADAGAPETETEAALFRAWKTLLSDHVEISVNDNFFALGGDSLRAMRMVTVARAEGIAVSVADIFRYPVLRDMAVVASKIAPEHQSREKVQPFSLLEQDWALVDARAEASELCGVGESTIEDMYPCSPLQEALMALSAKVKEAYVAQRVLKMESLEAAKRLQVAFESTAADSAILRTRIIQVSKRGLMQVVVNKPILWRSAGTLAEYLESDRDEEMGLGTPLVRYAVIREGNDAHFVLTMHHALYDGWSMPLIIDRVNRAYQKLPHQRPAAEFKDFVHYLKSSLDRTACDAYWREQLAGATGVQFPALPFEGYQTQADSLLELDVSLEGRRLPSSPGVTVTLATIVRAAWALVASQYTSGNTDIVFGETLTGRNAPIVGADEIEGPMITTVPVRVSVDRQITVEQYLQTIAEQIVGQMPYEHAGLQHIRRLSDDALQACELRTGFVLHPAAGEVSVDENTPANGLVPAGDTEAAQEALKFNTYALMLVCSLSPNGFFIMASFDSKTVGKETMQKVLDQLQFVARQLCEDGSKDTKIGDLQCLTSADRSELELLSKQVKSRSADSDKLVCAESDVEAIWIVDPVDSQRLLPRGAIGELLVETRKSLASPATLIEKPPWHKQLVKELAKPNRKQKQIRLYKTGRLARLAVDGDKPTLCVLRTTQLSNTSIAKKKSAPAASPTIAATSTKQKALRGIWSRLLNIDEDSIYLGDSFFNHGGDSITAMKLVSEARQQGLQLSVAQIFANRTLFDMANVMQASPDPSGPQDGAVARTEYKPFSLLGSDESIAALVEKIQASLADKSWQVTDVLPARPLQEIAVRGTVELPRFSIRYELLHFDGKVDKRMLFRACQELVARNEILRTVFVRQEGTCYGVVVDDIPIPVVEFTLDGGDIKPFTTQLCALDAQTSMPYGSSFVKWFFVTNGAQSSLVFRLSHAQYDEICLPIFLHQLHQLYTDMHAVAVPTSFPFSAFVAHTLRDSIPRAIPYWCDLLAGSAGITRFRPNIPITSRRHFAIHRAVSIAARSRDVTVATLPSAAWALTLARRLKIKDVVFGEVASGRSVDVPGVSDANAVAGPCWQYVPTRVRFDGKAPMKTGHDLLAALQHQHMTTSSYDSMGLGEIVRACTTWDPKAVDWFDSVVHQDVAHVEALSFVNQTASFETIYPYEEPLREWKIQAFRDGENMTLEVITFESWKDEAVKVLDEVVASLQQLVERPDEELRI
ncbi:putative AM-toxin synthetase [Podospora appendiculata]|uniref:Brevianamide F synthase n=1 Tax=Podospora appendiculata TaxID=314037 RepID=A0AAE1C708_9PEZI|nr:putative AM-toxin synthetase [Podospora appendiculata]